jgi:hypothetical protein
MTSLEKRIKALEDMVSDIHAVLVQGRAPAPPGDDEYYHALMESVSADDPTALLSYLKRGGKAPSRGAGKS